MAGLYREVQKIAESSRAEDYRMLAELTHALDQSRRSPNGMPEAIAANQRFWSMLRVSLSAPDNPLPQSLRTGLVLLADWVEKESIRAALGETGLDELIAVNRKVMEGLSPMRGSLAAGDLQPDGAAAGL